MGSKKRIRLPFHVAAQVEDGTILQSRSYWDNLVPSMATVAAKYPPSARTITPAKDRAARGISATGCLLLYGTRHPGAPLRVLIATASAF